MLEWSGWYGTEGGSRHDNEASATAQTLIYMAANLEPIGGGDYPEACETGLAHAHQLMRKNATTIVLLYTDAPPHCWMVADRGQGSNYHAEQAALKSPILFDGNG